jgi:hypothetical protein
MFVVFAIGMELRGPRDTRFWAHHVNTTRIFRHVAVHGVLELLHTSASRSRIDKGGRRGGTSEIRSRAAADWPIKEIRSDSYEHRSSCFHPDSNVGHEVSRCNPGLACSTY